ncbi:hypothetical protein F5Y17DRAFT_143862, partial [Xylariaceae sp. FL0594]
CTYLLACLCLEYSSTDIYSTPSSSSSSFLFGLTNISPLPTADLYKRTTTSPAIALPSNSPLALPPPWARGFPHRPLGAELKLDVIKLPASDRFAPVRRLCKSALRRRMRPPPLRLVPALLPSRPSSTRRTPLQADCCTQNPYDIQYIRP